MRRLHRLNVCACLALLALAPSGCVQMLFACVREGTPIATPDGERPIESLREGDNVWSMNEAGDLVVGRVTSVMPGRTARLVRIRAGGRVLDVTPQHLVMSDQRWTRADALVSRQNVVGTDHELSPIVVECVDGWASVRDLSVAPHENYFAAGVLVHNKTVVPPAAPWQCVGPWTLLNEGWLIRGTWAYQLELRENGSGEWRAWQLGHGYAPGACGAAGTLDWGVKHVAIEIKIDAGDEHGPWYFRGWPSSQSGDANVLDGVLAGPLGSENRTMLWRPSDVQSMLQHGGIPPPPVPTAQERRSLGDTRWQPERPSDREP